MFPGSPAHRAAAALLILSTGILACGDGAGAPTMPDGGEAGVSGTPSAGNGGGTGTLSMSITDSPFSDARALLVTFSEVSVHRSEGEGWETLAFAGGAGQRTCDLKKLQGPIDVLGVGTLPAGHYTQIRLHVERAALVRRPSRYRRVIRPRWRSHPAR
jgi:hypothetical protein